MEKLSLRMVKYFDISKNSYLNSIFMMVFILFLGIKTAHGLENCNSEYHNCFGQKEFPTGIYKGEWWKGYPHGEGTYNFFSGEIYIGEFKYGKQHGEGVARYNGKIFEGIWKNGKIELEKSTRFSKVLPKENTKASGQLLYSDKGIREEFRSFSLATRKRIQASLMNLGLYKSSIDGIWGKSTKGAVLEYVKANNLVTLLSSRAGSSKILSKIYSDFELVTKENVYNKSLRKKRDDREAAYTACYGFCIAQYGLQYFGSCAAKCSGASTPELNQSQTRLDNTNNSEGIFKGEIQKGFNKVCLYDNLGSVTSLTISATSLCPITN